MTIYLSNPLIQKNIITNENWQSENVGHANVLGANPTRKIDGISKALFHMGVPMQQKVPHLSEGYENKIEYWKKLIFFGWITSVARGQWRYIAKTRVSFAVVFRPNFSAWKTLEAYELCIFCMYSGSLMLRTCAWYVFHENLIKTRSVFVQIPSIVYAS